MPRDDLILELHFGTDLAQADVLGLLQATLAALAPRMLSTLHVHAHERDRDAVPVTPGDPDSLRAAVVARGLQRGATFEALAAHDPPPSDGRRFGSALLRARGSGSRGCYLSVAFDSSVPAMPIGDSWLWSNSISVSVSSARVEGRPRADWVHQLAVHLAAHPHLLWGAAYAREQFASSNLDLTHGMRAIGRDIRRHLPGLYWLNLFGRPYVELIGRDVLRGAAATVRATGDAVVVQAFDRPEQWPEAQGASARLREQLGADVFFDRAHPDRSTRAPDFGLRHLPARRPLQVVTSGGDQFTPLP